MREIQQILVAETGTRVDVSTIWRFLQISNITRQKMVMIAKQRSDILRAEYLLDMKIFHGHSEMLVFVDETGADRRNCLRRFGYSLRGKPAKTKQLLLTVSQPLQLCQLKVFLTATLLLVLLMLTSLLISSATLSSHICNRLMEFDGVDGV